MRAWIDATARLYADVFRRGASLALRNWAVGLLLIVYSVALFAVRVLAAPLPPLIGGLLAYVVSVACASSWLALVEQAIRSGRVRFADLPASFTTYLGDLMTIGFFLWLASFAYPALPVPARMLALLAGFVFLNAVPELVYLGRHTAAEILVESYRFIGENWIEWFPPNVILAAALLAVGLLPAGPFGLAGVAVQGVVLYLAMIVRGLLFLELASSSRRAREFRRRASG